MRLMGDKTIPDSAEPRLESFYPPWVAGIDLPHQGVVDSYNLLRRETHVFAPSNHSIVFEIDINIIFPQKVPIII